ncbi:hypothetical protein EDD36DRAFT_492499 [Exophiala viscosa]|uniref:Alcohol dehydrogenase-like C-terminal domain-containing protein n=1 Tax=Exophiala viscosa TaxID=2486360 RepID=A0AAN6IG89_9EURO|nr:hypothetical protein EDD36DRAFT_492499 [Exophiala viscosa]
MAKGDVQMRVPDQLTYEESATLALGAITVGQGLYQKSLKLNLPTDPIRTKEHVLIYGGGTATGGLAIQFARLSGYSVITICSGEDSERLKLLGAEECFDYRDPNVADKVRRLTGNNLQYAWDTVAIESSAKICANALSTYPGTQYGATNPIKSPRSDVQSSSIVMYTMFGESFSFGAQEFARSTEDFEFAKMFMGLTEKLLREDKIKTHPGVLKEHGLAGVLEGLDELKAGKVRSGKLVYRIADTPDPREC